jgi:hypothetical protein
MSSLRPGTVDYSHFDNISYSESDKEDDEPREERIECNVASDEEDDDEESERSKSSGGEFESEEEEESVVRPPPRQRPRVAVTTTVMSDPWRRTPAPDLGALQRAWGADAGDEKQTTTDEPNVRRCANCLRLSPPFKCSRCGVVKFCNV